MPNYRQDLIERELFLDEGYEPTAYGDTKGYPTVGIGRNIKAKGTPEYPDKDPMKDRYSEKEAYEMVRNDIIDTDSALAKKLPFYEKLDGKRQRVLINLAFNMGVNGMLKFKGMLGNLEKAVNATDPDTAKRFYKKSADNLEFNYDKDGKVKGNTGYWNDVKTRGPRVKYQLMTGQEHPYYEKWDKNYQSFRSNM